MFTLGTYAQDNAGIGTTSPHASAILELDSTTQGFLPPRLTTVQRDEIANPTVGLLIFNKDTDAFNLYSSTNSWIVISPL